MSAPRTLDDLDDLVMDADMNHNHADVAERLEAFASTASPQDEVGRAELLVAAAEQHGLAGDTARAVALCRLAVEDGGTVRLDARAHLIASLARAGELGEATRTADDLRASKPRNPECLLFVGEHLEMMGDLNRALAWYTRGVLRVESGDDDISLLVVCCSSAGGECDVKLAFPRTISTNSPRTCWRRPRNSCRPPVPSPADGRRAHAARDAKPSTAAPAARASAP